VADSFTHLHVHTEYSMLDGAARLDELVAAAAADGQPALGITDHGNMYGILDFYRACKDRGVKPILGTEAYMAHDHRSERIAARGRMDDTGGEGEGDKKPWYHLTLLAESEVGYKNLIQLASRSFMEGYYRKPKVDWELLEEHSEGLIATTGCLGGHVLQAMVPKAIMDPDKQQADPLSEDERFDNAVKLAGRLQDIFGRDNLFVELQDHGIPAQQWSNPRLAELAKAIRAPLLATNDSHYVHRDDSRAHDALLCQPPGTMVRRVAGRGPVDDGSYRYRYEEVPIEEVREGDRVLSWSGQTRRGQIHKKGSTVTKVGAREYRGKLVRVTTDRGRSSRYTADHICIARTDVALPQGNHVVYLMRRGASFRLGATTHKRSYNNNPLGVIVRAKEQGADDVWILSVHADRNDALLAEALLSFEYGIPTWQFRSNSNEWVDLDRFWSKVGDLTARARWCLEDHHRLLEYPFWSAGTSGSSRRPREIRACNLLDGMLVCEPDECTDPNLRTYDGSKAWSRITVEVEPYAGVVHSIDVAGDHTYVADGIVTHNCVQTNSLVSDKNRFKFHGDEHYLKSAEEMRYLFRELPTACDNTLWVAERCEVEIEFGKPQLPSFPLPPGFEDDDAYLHHLVFEGARKRWGDQLDDRITERLVYELKVIGDMGFSSYFLITWDLIKHARDNGIRVGPGRGSAAGCAVAYTLWITDLDPIKYDLLFERFLNPSRISMPDIDMDFDTRYRDEMIRYAAERYGRENVAQIITFGTIKARQAVRDAARVLGHDYGTGDRIAKAMPPLIMGRDTPLHACLEEHPKYVDGYKMATELRSMYETDPTCKEVIDVAKGLEGLRRSDGIHAAAVVITKDPLTTYLPIQRKPEPGKPIEEAPVVTQYEMHGVEDLGLLKMDFLGLRNLDIISDALELVKMTRGIEVDIDSVDLEDEPTYELLRRGDTVGVFQLESPPMRALMRSLAPDTFEDVAALVALYRPGPMAANMHNDYADRKNGRKPIAYLHPDAEEILGATYGLMIYQESVMRIAQKFAGYSLAEADNLRKACGKKIRELIAKEREKFEAGCEAHGYGRELGKAWFDIIEPFADYAFNKSHSYGYGFIAYQIAYLKANYPAEYMSALLTSVKSNLDKAAVYLAECRAMGIPVTVADVNRSLVDFAPELHDDGSAEIVFGMSAVRGVGTGHCELIIAERDANGPFTDFYDFCERVDLGVLNKKTVEALIKAGAFDSCGHKRQGLLMVFESIVDRTIARRKEAEAGVMSLFDQMVDDGSGGGGALGFDDREEIPDVEFPKAQKLAFEKEMLGLYVSDHPLFGAEDFLARRTDVGLDALAECEDGAIKTVGGVITGLQRKWTKKGDLMGVFVLEDLRSSAETMVFPRTMTEHGHKLEDDAIVLVKARIDKRDDMPKLIAMEIEVVEGVSDAAEPFRLAVSPGRLSAELIASLKEILLEHPGDHPVLLHLGDDKVLRLPPAYGVDGGSGLVSEIRVLLGPAALVG
jgi:DNA polymerase III subunit alpha